MQQDNLKVTLPTTTFSQINDSTEIGNNNKKEMMGNQRWEALTCAFTSGFFFSRRHQKHDVCFYQQRPQSFGGDGNLELMVRNNLIDRYE